MIISKIKTFFIIFPICFIIFFLISFFRGGSNYFFYGFYMSSLITSLIYICGFHRSIQDYFEEKYYKIKDEENFQINLRREVERKRALSAVDNENLHYQNQLKIEYIAQVAQIHLQSNQQLANMYQQAIINNSTQNELTAQKQLLELEEELKKQGLI